MIKNPKLISTEQYPDNYKPSIYYGNYIVSVMEAKHRELAKRSPEQAKKHIKNFIAVNLIMVLDEKQLFPTEEYYMDALKKAVKKEFNKIDTDKYIYWIRSLQPQKHMGKINYDFKK